MGQLISSKPTVIESRPAGSPAATWDRTRVGSFVVQRTNHSATEPPYVPRHCCSLHRSSLCLKIDDIRLPLFWLVCVLSSNPPPPERFTHVEDHLYLRTLCSDLVSRQEKHARTEKERKYHSSTSFLYFNTLFSGSFSLPYVRFALCLVSISQVGFEAKTLDLIVPRHSHCLPLHLAIGCDFPGCKMSIF